MKLFLKKILLLAIILFSINIYANERDIVEKYNNHSRIIWDSQSHNKAVSLLNSSNKDGLEIAMACFYLKSYVKSQASGKEAIDSENEKINFFQNIVKNKMKNKSSKQIEETINPINAEINKYFWIPDTDKTSKPRMYDDKYTALMKWNGGCGILYNFYK